MPQRKPEHRSTQNTLGNADAEDIPIINMSCCVADNRSKGARKCGKTDLTRGNIHPLTQKARPFTPETHTDRHKADRKVRAAKTPKKSGGVIVKM